MNGRYSLPGMPMDSSTSDLWLAYCLVVHSHITYSNFRKMKHISIDLRYCAFIALLEIEIAKLVMNRGFRLCSLIHDKS